MLLVKRKRRAKLSKVLGKAEFTRWFDSVWSIPEYISVTEVSKMIGVNEEFCYQLVKRGYLHHKSDSRKTKVIFPDHSVGFLSGELVLSPLSIWHTLLRSLKCQVAYELMTSQNLL